MLYIHNNSPIGRNKINYFYNQNIRNFIHVFLSLSDQDEVPAFRRNLYWHMKHLEDHNWNVEYNNLFWDTFSVADDKMDREKFKLVKDFEAAGSQGSPSDQDVLESFTFYLERLKDMNDNLGRNKKLPNIDVVKRALNYCIENNFSIEGLWDKKQNSLAL